LLPKPQNPWELILIINGILTRPHPEKELTYGDSLWFSLKRARDFFGEYNHASCIATRKTWKEDEPAQQKTTGDKG